MTTHSALHSALDGSRPRVHGDEGARCLEKGGGLIFAVPMTARRMKHNGWGNVRINEHDEHTKQKNTSTNTYTNTLEIGGLFEPKKFPPAAL